MRKDHLRARVCLTLVLLFLFLSGPASVLGNWGLEVGRANAADVADLAQDWMTYRRERARLDEMSEMVLGIERQRQLLGAAAKGLTNEQLYLEAQEYFLDHLTAPLQRIALSPAASCAEARFALAEMIGVRRQQQMMDLEESAEIGSVYVSIEAMTKARCRDEALDECVATGRFKQIIDLMIGTQRQMQMLGEEGDEESWAEDALKQCAIYELHFVSRTNTRDSGLAGPVEIETVRDGRVQIRFEIPPGGLKTSRASLGQVLKGETKGGNDPFFVSVKCKAPQPTGVPPVEFICSPGADSTPIKIGINELDLKHREFYIAFEKDKYTLREAPFPRERVVGEDKFSFTFEGGEFNLQGLIKVENETVPVPMPGVGIAFYMAHKKDQMSSSTLKIENTKRGVYPTVFHFTYAGIGDADESGVLSTDSTDFELIHKPEPKPFEKVPEPIRKPLKPPAK